MSEHPNVIRVRDAFEAWNDGNTGPFESLIADDVVWHEIGGNVLNGKEALWESMSDLEDAEFSVEIHDVVGNDEHVVALVEATVTAGGDQLSYRTAELFHMSDGRITERWSMAEDTGPITDFFSKHG